VGFCSQLTLCEFKKKFTYTRGGAVRLKVYARATWKTYAHCLNSCCICMYLHHSHFCYKTIYRNLRETSVQVYMFLFRQLQWYTCYCCACLMCLFISPSLSLFLSLSLSSSLALYLSISLSLSLSLSFPLFLSFSLFFSLFLSLPFLICFDFD
jgi:hypothetical protein